MIIKEFSKGVYLQILNDSMNKTFTSWIMWYIYNIYTRWTSTQLMSIRDLDGSECIDPSYT